jgi:hypothetical protein
MSETTSEQPAEQPVEETPEKPVETTEKPAKQSQLDALREQFPVETVVYFEKTDDKGKRGTVKGHEVKFGAAYVQVEVQLAGGKTRMATTRGTSIRQWTDADQAAYEAAEAEKAEKKRLADEAKAKAKQEADEKAKQEASPAEPQEAEAAQVVDLDAGAEENGSEEPVVESQPARRRRK